MHVEEAPMGRVKGEGKSSRKRTKSYPPARAHISHERQGLPLNQTQHDHHLEATHDNETASEPWTFNPGISRGTKVGDELGVTRCNTEKSKVTLAQAARQPSVNQTNEQLKGKLAFILGKMVCSKMFLRSHS